MPERPPHINELVKKYTNYKVPHFFKYAKDCEEHNVEKTNSSVVNRLEKVFIENRLNFKKKEFGRVDYRLLVKNPNIEIDEELIKCYKGLNRSYRLIVNNEDNNNKNLNYVSIIVKDKLSKFGYDSDQVNDMLVKYLFEDKNSMSKELYWFSYGGHAVENLRKNLEGKDTVCTRCGRRFEKIYPNQTICLDCPTGKPPMVEKIVVCAKCSKKETVPSKDNASVLCRDCAKEERRAYQRELMRKRRQELKEKC